MHKITTHDVDGVLVKVWHPNKKYDDPCYQISLDSGGWLCGSYETIDAALLGAKHDLMLNEDFYNLQKKINHFDKENRLITVNDFKGINCEQ